MDGFAGILLAGQVTEHGDLSVGDTLLVPTKAGLVAALVTGFPLIRWVEERRGWQGVTVDGVSDRDVLVGDLAVSDDPDAAR